MVRVGYDLQERWMSLSGRVWPGKGWKHSRRKYTQVRFLFNTASSAAPLIQCVRGCWD
jgi:hypothetical protein